MPLDRNQTLERVRKVLAEQMGLDKKEADAIKLETSPVDDLGADSLDQVEIIMAFEEEFETEIEDDIAENIRTVGQAVEILMHSGNTAMQEKISRKMRHDSPRRYQSASIVKDEPEHKLIPLSAIVKTDYMEDAVKTFVEKFNANMESGRSLHNARVTDLEGSDAFEIAMGARLAPHDIDDISYLLKESGFIFQHVVEHIECFEGENGESYEIVSYVSYTLPKWSH